MKAKDEIGAQKGHGRIAAVRSLLEFTETFEALQAERVGDDGADAIHKYYGGIWKQFQQLLDSWKVQPFSIEPGAAYDYKKIQTVESVASDDIPKDTVIEMVERGWEMDGETVRLAKCKVSSGPAVVAEEEPAAAEEAGAEERALKSSEPARNHEAALKPLSADGLRTFLAALAAVQCASRCGIPSLCRLGARAAAPLGAIMSCGCVRVTPDLRIARSRMPSGDSHVETERRAARRARESELTRALPSCSRLHRLLSRHAT